MSIKTSRREFHFTFPVGYHRFHRNQLFNFQLNRWYSLGYARFEDMAEAGSRIATFEDWKREMLSLAKQALREERLVNAAFYYRAAEFYTMPDDPDKEILYDRFIDLFYRAFERDRIARHLVHYQGAFLPAITVPAASEKKGTVLIHGGFDSFIEEWYSVMLYFSDHGYDVIGFEGPGQGAARRNYGLPFDYRWEQPVGAVLDYFDLDDATLLGMSMGGWFGLRAAASDSRIRRVIATGHAFDYFKMAPLPIQWFAKFFLQFEGFSNWSANLKMKYMPRSSRAYWEITHSMYITKTNTALAALKQMLQLNEENLHAEMIKQDVLVLAGREDHFIPIRMHKMQIQALSNARSVTGRVFTREEHAQNHCQTGNIALALDVMREWIEDRRRAS